MFSIDAACVSVRGLIRTKQEDNLFFFQQHPEIEETDRKYSATVKIEHKRPIVFAVFDGVGGAQHGDLAAYEAAQCLKKSLNGLSAYPGKDFLLSVCQEMNEAVFKKHLELSTGKMGTTVSMLLFADENVYSCNLGDSRAYRLRGKKFSQFSSDHLIVDEATPHRKAPLSQYLGMDPMEIRLEPHLSHDSIRRGDKYLLCTDGLTDMASNLEIEEIMERSCFAEDCAKQLVDYATAKGGRDNITVILCEIIEDIGG